MQLGVTVAQIMAFLKGCPEDFIYEIQSCTLPTIMTYHERFFLHEWMGMQVIEACYNRREVISYPYYLIQKVKSGELRLDSDNRCHTIEYLSSYMQLKYGQISIRELCPPGAFYAKMIASGANLIDKIGAEATSKVVEKGSNVNYSLSKVNAHALQPFCKYLS